MTRAIGNDVATDELLGVSNNNNNINMHIDNNNNNVDNVTVAAFEPYRPPKHDSIVDGVVVPQSPLDDSLASHLQYENDLLKLLRQ